MGESCVILLRNSDTRATEDDFEIQEDICRKYAQEKGYSIHAVYTEAHSGKHSPQTRTELRKAIADIKAKRASVLVVSKYNRLARNTEQSYAVVYEIEQLLGGRVEAAQDQLDRSSPVAKIVFGIYAGLAEMDRDNVVQRFEAGKRKRSERGNLTGARQPLYGYRWVDDSPGKRTAYEIDPVSSAVVRQIFQWAIEGQPMREIVRLLNAQGTPTPSAHAAQYKDPGGCSVGRYWHIQQVRKIIQDERLAGKPAAFQTVTTYEKRDSRDREYRHQIRSENPIALSTDVWPSLVTQEIFQLANKQVKSSVAGRKPTDPSVSLFRGQVFCAGCSRRMRLVRKHEGTTYSYICATNHNAAGEEEKCPYGWQRILCTKVDSVGWEGLKMLMRHRENFTRVIRERCATPHDTGFLDSTLGVMREKQEQYQNLARRIAMTDSDTVAQALIGQMEVIAKELEKLQVQAAKAQKQVDEASAADAWTEAILSRVYGWQKVQMQAVYKDGHTEPREMELWGREGGDEDLDKLPFEVKRMAVEASGIRIDVYPAGLSAEAVEGTEVIKGRVRATFQYQIDNAHQWTISTPAPLRLGKRLMSGVITGTTIRAGTSNS